MKSELELTYEELRSRFLIPVAGRLEAHLQHILRNESRIDRISVRAKTVDRFVAKSRNVDSEGNQKYVEPLSQIQDMIGARIVTFYLSDVEKIAEVIDDYFKKIEEQRLVPDSADKFGYEGKHFVLFLPKDVQRDEECSAGDPKFFELQIKTLFQHAWGEASHDMAYKAKNDLTEDQKRQVAYGAAQAWGGDRIFEELSQQLCE